MNRTPVAPKVLSALIVAALALPIMICILLALAAVLSVMNDATGVAVLRYVALAGGVAWVMVLVGLILVQALHTLGGSDDAEQ